ncbi:MAG: 2,4-dihydroxyhept-2-ene-1,7-dioic acid aldolase [Magnetococcales bacterium]|nr:2,4-dihydroxyhept-2-ene-1,7-dioic acid aldolase [Magnetococcales bacterium]
MNRRAAVARLRERLGRDEVSIGSWMQIPHPSVAEILGEAGYEWVAIDMEHGSIALHQLPDLFRAVTLGGSLPLVRLAQGSPKDCKQALDAGAAGVIVPMVETAAQMEAVREACCWPPVGTRGVGFSRANLFGKHFDDYAKEAQAPLLVAQIEHIRGVENLASIIAVPGLDTILVGPYDLSASMGLTGQFDHPTFQEAMRVIIDVCQMHHFPAGIHVVMPRPNDLRQRIADGYRFIAYSIDAVFLLQSSLIPDIGQGDG